MTLLQELQSDFNKSFVLASQNGGDYTHEISMRLGEDIGKYVDAKIVSGGCACDSACLGGYPAACYCKTHTHSYVNGYISGSADTGAVSYTGITQTAGAFYGGTDSPSNTTRLNYSGYLYATQLYEGTNRVCTSAYPTTLPASDVYAWAKAVSKPTYTYSEVGALAVDGCASDSAKLGGCVPSYYQICNADLTCIAALTGTGYLQRTGAGSWCLGAGGGVTAYTVGIPGYGAVCFNCNVKADGTFYAGTTDPTCTTRLNYDGNLYATNFNAYYTVKAGNANFCWWPEMTQYAHCDYFAGIAAEAGSVWMALRSSKCLTGMSISHDSALGTGTTIFYRTMNTCCAAGCGCTCKVFCYANNSDNVYFADNISIPRIWLNRSVNCGSGLSFYCNTYTAWQIYMGPPTTPTCQGYGGNLTPPAGWTVTSWALRSFIENNNAGYGWIWEGGAYNSCTPSVIAELNSCTGNFRTIGTMCASEFCRGSSREYKECIQPYGYLASNIINNVKIYEYRLKNSKEYGIGFISEETDMVLSGEDQKGHNMGNHLGILTKSFQELYKDVEKIKRELRLN